jgi:enoyl-CoA hydratase
MIHLDFQEDVAVIRMEHGKANAIDLAFFDELGPKLDEVEQSDSKSVVLTGTGSIFSAGVDLFQVLQGGQEYVKSFLPALTEGLLKIFNYPKPVIAAINGHAIAGGCILVCACDYRVFADGKGTIGVPERVVGVPFPALAMEILRFAVPSQHLQELVYTGKTFRSTEALQKGLVDEIVDAEQLIDRAAQLASQFGQGASRTFQITKEQLRQPSMERFERTRGDVDRKAQEVWSSQEAQDAVRQFLEKRVGK